MKKFFKELLCKHSYQIVRWHWFHGFLTMEPRRIEVELFCNKCGKTVYRYPKRRSEDEKFVAFIIEKQW